MVGSRWFRVKSGRPVDFGLVPLLSGGPCLVNLACNTSNDKIPAILTSNDVLAQKGRMAGVHLIMLKWLSCNSHVCLKSGSSHGKAIVSAVLNM